MKTYAHYPPTKNLNELIVKRDGDYITDVWILEGVGIPKTVYYSYKKDSQPVIPDNYDSKVITKEKAEKMLFLQMI